MIGGLYYLGNRHHISLSTIVEFVMYINMLTFPVSAIGLTASMIQRAAASQKRINEFLDTAPSIRNPVVADTSTILGKISFQKVNFTYPHTGIRALKDFDLEIKKGEKVAIIGKTGSGKSTIAQLLLRMYDADSGTIKLDEINIRDKDLATIREQVSFVPQDVFLFSDTVENNILFGVKEGEKPAVGSAAERACVDKEIAGFTDQYHTLIGERGVTLSGGQKQRLTIARALIKNPAIIIFDDCLSAVDARTERKIINNLDAYLIEKTAIIITHRIFSHFRFNKIVVIDNGKIVEQGTHYELLALNGYYAGLYARQQLQDNNGTDAGVKTTDFG
jgi:ATP-binding cassette subfamily B protein